MNQKNKKKKEEERQQEEVEKSLSAIYRDEKGELPDLTNFETKRTRWWLYGFVGGALGVLFIIAAAWLGFSIFKPFRGFSGQGLGIFIEGPEQIALGQETSYFIHYRNLLDEPLASSEIRVSFPSDFMVSNAEPPATGEGLAWRLGSLAASGQGTIKVRGVFTGALHTVTAIQIVGTYRPGSFNSDFETLVTKVLKYEDSVFKGSLEVPAKVLPGDRVVMRYAVINTGSEPYAGLEIRMQLPEGFELEGNSSTTKLEGRLARFSLDRLEAGASTTVVVAGSFASGIGGEAHVVAEMGRSAADGNFLPAQRSETSFMVLAGDLSLKLVINGQEGEIPLLYGQPLQISAGYENTASEDLKNIRLRLRLEQVSSSKSVKEVVDWKSLDDANSGILKGNVVTWTKAEIPVLERLPSREDGMIELSLKSLSAASGTSGLAVRAILEAEIETVGDTKVQRVVRSQPLILRYLTDARIEAQARYFSEEGAPLGSGPLPPLVASSTTYRIQWSVAKRFHELKDLVVQASLPKNVDWPGAVFAEAGTITYDPVTRIVRWTLNRLPEDVHELLAEFSVRLTPLEVDANRFAPLLGETKFEAMDVIAKTLIKGTSPTLTTDLPNDEGAKGKGVVRKP